MINESKKRAAPFKWIRCGREGDSLPAMGRLVWLWYPNIEGNVTLGYLTYRGWIALNQVGGDPTHWAAIVLPEPED